MSESKPQKSEGCLIFLIGIAIVVAAFILGARPHLCHGQTPSLVVSAGSNGSLAPSLTITSDSTAPWKGFLVTGGSNGTVSNGTTNVVWAESNGTTGGIYFGAVTIVTGSSNSGPMPGPGPAPAGLPIASLSSAATAAVSGLPPADVQAMANSYEALAKQMDAGTIVSPLQLQLATGTNMLASFSSTQLEGFKTFNSAVTGWLDAQQCSGKLTADKIGDYARAYHAVATALGGWKVAPVSGHRMESPPTQYSVPSTPAPAAPKSPCANGQCPAQKEDQRWFRWRNK